MFKVLKVHGSENTRINAIERIMPLNSGVIKASKNDRNITIQMSIRKLGKAHNDTKSVILATDQLNAQIIVLQ